MIYQYAQNGNLRGLKALQSRGYALDVYDANGNKLKDFEVSDTITFEAVYYEKLRLTITYSLYEPKKNTRITTYTSLPESMADASTNDYSDFLLVPISR